MKTKKIINKLIISEENVINLIQSSINNSQKLLLTYCNQHCFNIMYDNLNYSDIIENKFHVFIDGYGMFKAYNFLQRTTMSLFNATDIYYSILEYLSKKNIPVFIIGGNFSQETLQEKNAFKTNFVGYQKGYFDISKIDYIANNVVSVKTNVVMIGMGVPNQEMVAEKLSNFLDDSVILCVGNFLEFYFGTSKRIPSIFRNKGMEWIYRLLQEPKRLWRRYLIGIPLFIFRIIKFKIELQRKIS